MVNKKLNGCQMNKAILINCSTFTLRHWGALFSLARPG